MKVQALKTVTRYLNGKPVSIKAGEFYSKTSKAYKTFGHTLFTVPSTKRSSKTSTTSTTISDNLVLNTIMAYHEAGVQILGNYRQVWEQLCNDMGVESTYCHFRGLQIARCGRRYQELVRSNCFDLLCPDLVESASSWSN